MPGFEKTAFFSRKNLLNSNCEQRVLHCPPRCQDMLFPNWRYHIQLLGNIEKTIQKPDTICFTYQHVNCRYTLFNCQFSEIFVVKGGQAFDNPQRTVWFIQETEEWTECLASRKRYSGGKNRKHLLSCFSKSKSTQTSGSIFAEKSEQVKKKQELEIKKLVDSFYPYFSS